MRAIAGHVDALGYELEAMRALKTNGRVEAARVAGAEEAAAVARIDILRDARAAASIRLDATDLRTRLQHLRPHPPHPSLGFRPGLDRAPLQFL